jgi:hypothetical protein
MKQKSRQKIKIAVNFLGLFPGGFLSRISNRESTENYFTTPASHVVLCYPSALRALRVYVVFQRNPARASPGRHAHTGEGTPH